MKKPCLEHRVLPGEPDYQTACTWWPDAKGQVTPVGWKDHMFRFNILYNGTLLAQPDPRLVYSPFKRFEAWEGMGVQLNFPYLDAYRWWEHHGRGDDGLTQQGWADRPTPVLWSRWPRHGLLIQQEVFGYVPGGGPVQTGVEPLFAWVRFTLLDRTPALVPENPPHGRFNIDVRINRPHVIPTMECALHLLHNWPDSKYPRALHASRSYSAGRGYRITEQGRQVRLAVAPGGDYIAEFHEGQPTANDHLLRLWIPPRKGSRIDLLVPMLPCPPRIADDVLRRGFDAALRDADRFWQGVPETAVKFDVPEAPVTRTIRISLRSVALFSEKNPKDGQYSLLVGSFGYPMIWGTQIAMEIAMTLDPFGMHREADRFLETFRRYQGQREPASCYIPKHPGYLSGPTDRCHIPWITDHGAILYAVCRHIQLTADADFIARWTDPIVKACDFIRTGRALREHGGVEGLFPPATASDRGILIQGVWSDGWLYKGYTAAIQVLQKLGHPRAAEFERDARQYRLTFIRAIRAQTRRMPAWRDGTGRRHHLVPMSLHFDAPKNRNARNKGVDEDGTTCATVESDARHPFYLDTGPLFLVFSGLLDADDPLMVSARLWFREGPPHRHYRRESSRWQPPVLDHEMSSCEPYYSWNLFHAHQSGDRHRFLEGMYSQFAGACSRQTFSFMEQRNSQFALSPQYPCFLMARLAVIDDQIRAGELHLLRLMPLAWLRRGQACTFANMPTDFGPVSLRVALGKDGTTLRIRFDAAFREPPRSIILHRPPLSGLRRILLNRQELKMPVSMKTLDITGRLSS